MEVKDVEFYGGDILLFSTSPGGEGSLSRIMKAAQRRKKEEKTFASHVEIVGKGGKLLPDNNAGITTIGTSYPEMKERDLISHTDSLVRVYRLKKADRFYMQEMVDDLRGRAKGIVPEKYGTGVIVAHALDYALNFAINFVFKTWPDMRPFTLMSGRNKSVCSSLVAKSYENWHSISFGMRPRLIQPDDIDDFCRDHPNQFEMIFEGKI